MDKLGGPISWKHTGMPECIARTAEDTIRRKEWEIHAQLMEVGHREEKLSL